MDKLVHICVVGRHDIGQGRPQGLYPQWWAVLSNVYEPIELCKSFITCYVGFKVLEITKKRQINVSPVESEYDIWSREYMRGQEMAQIASLLADTLM